jgi:hypothetical protein
MAQCACGSEISTQTIYVSDGKPKCGRCRAELDDYAFENTSMAQRFDPVLVFQSVTDDREFSFPGRNTEACPPGYKPIVLDSLRAADQFTKRFNAIEGEKGRTERALNHLYFDQRTKARRDDIRARIRGNPRAESLFRQVTAMMDKKRAAKRDQEMRWQPNGSFQVFSGDASNRQGWADSETDWRTRKS